MTLIDKAEALAAVYEADSLELAQHGANRIAERIAALPARGVGVPTVDELANIIRTVDGQNMLGAGALAEAILAALAPTTAADPGDDVSPSASDPVTTPPTGAAAAAVAPTDAAHFNVAPKSEHDAGNVLTDYILAPHLQKIVEGAKTATQWDMQADRLAPTDAAQERESALREAAAVVGKHKHHWEDAQRHILALIGEART